MRTLFIALSMMASVVAGATDSDKVSSAVLNSFKNTFASAQEVTWTETDQFYKAEFNFNGQYVTAFYNGDGSLVAVTKNIASNQLPVKLQAALKCDYQNYWISSLFEVSNDEGTTYYVTVENADKKVILKSSGNNWSVFQKSEKI